MRGPKRKSAGGARASSAAASDYARIEKAIRYIEAHLTEQPGLEELAEVVGLSAFHFQRLFHRWAGVTPKSFVQFLLTGRARSLLQDSRSLLDSSLELGLSGTSRLHDLFLDIEQMTPGEYKAQAAGLTIRWGVHDTPLGEALFAVAPRGLCGLGFLETSLEASHATSRAGAGPRARRIAALDELRARWPGARWQEDSKAAAPFAAELSGRLRGQPPAPLSLLLKGTPFQLKVWEALLRIPEGGAASYESLAGAVGAKSAARAVAGAVGANPVAVLIPCHRVLRATGAFGGYHWGVHRKQALLALEQARRA